jgi:hypothetical protein
MDSLNMPRAALIISSAKKSFTKKQMLCVVQVYSALPGAFVYK